jgi:glycogen debranching enzyme
MIKSNIEICYEKSIELLEKNTIPEGFMASSSLPHYAAVWSRDACITSLGANLSENDKLIEASRNTLKTLSRLQAPKGQIPAVYSPTHNYWDWGEMGAADSSAWFIIAAWHYFANTGDSSLIKDIYPSLKKALDYLAYQDANNFGLIDSPEAADWMDSTLNRSGKVMYVNALFYLACKAMCDLDSELGLKKIEIETEELKFKFNLLFWPSTKSKYADMLRHVGYDLTGKEFPHPCSLSAFREASKDRKYYLSHVSYGKFVDMCDVFGNLLSVMSGLADAEKAAAIRLYLKDKEVSRPYPAKCLSEPVFPGGDYWGVLSYSADEHQDPRWKNPPYSYHNGAVWPFIGGFYVVTLLANGDCERGLLEMENLAAANRLGKEEWGFHEWINGETGQPAGAPFQSWNAGAYIMAYAVFKSKNIVFKNGFPVLK